MFFNRLKTCTALKVNYWYFCTAILLLANGCSDGQKKESEIKSIPKDMVFIQGGTSSIGSNNGQPNEQPVFEANVPSFYMDKNLVTVQEFEVFVEETGYVTEAEMYGNGLVFDFKRGEWVIAEGATWRYPSGPEGEYAKSDHPVRQVSWNDAKNYLEWVGKRLPTEIEWEYAAKGGKDTGKPYAWGESLVDQGRYQANTWTGTFPIENIAEDGYLQTSPVGKFGVTEIGLTDMGGNVWEWTQDWYRSYAERKRPFKPSPNSEIALRGGSFMCHVSYCHGYRVSARSHTTPDNALFHVGFRGVMDL